MAIYTTLNSYLAPNPLGGNQNRKQVVKLSVRSSGVDILAEYFPEDLPDGVSVELNPGNLVKKQSFEIVVLNSLSVCLFLLNL